MMAVFCTADRCCEEGPFNEVFKYVDHFHVGENVYVNCGVKFLIVSNKKISFL